MCTRGYIHASAFEEISIGQQNNNHVIVRAGYKGSNPRQPHYALQWGG